MKSYKEEAAQSQTQISLSDFLEYYNKNTPEGFPKASETLLVKFKHDHATLFKHGDHWSLDEHRKKVFDWFQLNRNI